MTAALRPARSSAAARSRAVRRSSAPRSPLPVPASSGGTTTTTSRIRSGGTPALMTLPARVARKLTVSSGSFTRNASGVPGSSRETASLATRSARPSSSEMNGSWRFHAIAEPASIVSVSAAVDDDGERSTLFESAPQADEPEGGQDRDREPERHEPIGGEPPGHERERHADEREDEPRAQDPAGVAVRRREADRGERHRDPVDVPRPAMDEAVEVRAPELGGEAGPPQERVLRRVDLQRWRSRPHGQQPDPERGGAADGGPRDPERLAPIASARRGRLPRAGSRRTQGGTAGGRGRRPRARSRRVRPPGAVGRPAARPPRGTPPR